MGQQLPERVDSLARIHGHTSLFICLARIAGIEIFYIFLDVDFFAGATPS